MGEFRGLGLAHKTIEKNGGLKYAEAAVAEGFCPTCTVRLKPRPEHIELTEDPYPAGQQATGWCATCDLVWTIGRHTEHLDRVAGPTWLAIDDVYEGMLRRMSFNPAPDPDDYDDGDWDDDL